MLVSPKSMLQLLGLVLLMAVAVNLAACSQARFLGTEDFYATQARQSGGSAE
jgi:hypothetical protein